jgi:hypothetical protein
MKEKDENTERKKNVKKPFYFIIIRIIVIH